MKRTLKHRDDTSGDISDKIFTVCICTMITNYTGNSVSELGGGQDLTLTDTEIQNEMTQPLLTICMNIVLQYIEK